MQLDVSGRPKVARALQIATQHHFGILRKYTGEEYIRHPIRVAEKLLLFSSWSDDVLAAALLHDCLEDKNINGHVMHPHYISTNIGPKALRYVELLTNTEKGNRAERKLKAAQRIAMAPLEVQAIKLCDIMDNLKGIATHDPQFASVYIEEKRQVVGMIVTENKVIQGMISAAKDIIAEETNVVALWRLQNGREEQVQQQKDEEEIRSIIAEEERSIYSDFSLF